MHAWPILSIVKTFYYEKVQTCRRMTVCRAAHIALDGAKGYGTIQKARRLRFYKVGTGFFSYLWKGGILRIEIKFEI